jgi:flagella synthesis protein FlgN
MFPTSSATTLSTLLEEEQQCLAKMLALLQKEEAVLAGGTVEEIVAVTSEKTTLLGAINSFVSQRAAYVAASGFTADRAGMASFFSAQPDLLGACYSLWSEILESWLKTHSQNRRNESLLRIRAQHNERALNVLRQAAGGSGTYNSDGSAQSLSSTRTSLLVG